MPTAFTHKLIQDKLSFAEYATLCARNFGALASVREEEFSPIIPDAIEVESFYEERLKEAQDQVTLWETTVDSLKQEWFEEKRAKKITSYQNSINEADQNRLVLLQTLGDVIQWEPPTEAHQGLKKFMQSQIEETIKSDCDTQWYRDQIKAWEQVDWATYQIQEKARIYEAVKQARKSLKEATQRCNERTQWIQDLKNSLKDVEAEVNIV